MRDLERLKWDYIDKRGREYVKNYERMIENEREWERMREKKRW